MTVCLVQRLLRCLGRKWFGGTCQALMWDEDLDAKVVRGFGTMTSGKDIRIERLRGDVRLIACLRALKRKSRGCCRVCSNLQIFEGFCYCLDRQDHRSAPEAREWVSLRSGRVDDHQAFLWIPLGFLLVVE